MNLGNRTITPELWITAILLVLAVLSLLFLGALVAPPKVLLGRSLTAIEPALFPSLILTLLAMLCAIQIAATLRRDEQGTESDGMLNGWRRGAILFLIMTFYALAMEPFGFLISTAISVAAMAVLIGNRSIPQMLAMSFISPIALYLIATRVLAVSLPELSAIEFAYSRILGS